MSDAVRITCIVCAAAVVIATTWRARDLMVVLVVACAMGTTLIFAGVF